jgi:hypothetical protein
MIPLSDRHALPVIVAMFLLAIPIGYQALLRPRVDDCASPARLREPDLFPFSTRDDDPPGRPPRYAIEGGQGELLIDRPWTMRPRWRLERSYDLTELHFEPRSFSNFFPERTVETLVRSANGVDLPIHTVVEESKELWHFGAYLYVFGGRPVRRPLVASLHHAIQQIIGGALPLNMIVVEGGSKIEHARENEEILIEWMRSAWIEFNEACGS